MVVGGVGLRVAADLGAAGADWTRDEKWGGADVGVGVGGGHEVGVQGGV